MALAEPIVKVVVGLLGSATDAPVPETDQLVKAYPVFGTAVMLRVSPCPTYEPEATEIFPFRVTLTEPLLGLALYVSW